MGMENSLHALVFWCAVWLCVEFLIRVQNKERPNFWSLTIVLILNAWTRLDSALLSTILFAFCVGALAYQYRHNLRLFLESYGKNVAGSSFLAGIGLIVQVTAFRVMGDSFLPISALVKTSGAGRGVQLEPVEKFVLLFKWGMPSILQGRFPDLILILIGISGILLVILGILAIRDYSNEIRPLLNLWLCLLAGETIYHLYVIFSEVEYSRYYIWYRSPSFIFGIITESLLALFILAASSLLVRRRINLLRWVPAGLALVIFATAIYVFTRHMNSTSKLYTARYNAALWMEENSAPDTVFASWNAGQLGFFSNRTVINLDGVINSVDYYERVIVGSTSVTEYLIENDVDFVVDYSTYDSIPEFPIVQTFPLNDGTGRSIKVWQVSPQLSADS
jgi:hypothetical protein